MPMGLVSLCVTFVITMDGTIRTSIPGKIRIALRSRTTLFYSGGLVLNIVSSIPLTPAALF